MKKVVKDLIDYGTVKRAVLGITMQPVDKKIAEEMKLSSVRGVYIYEVAKGSAAEEAGLKKGDVIVALGGQTISDGASVQAKVNEYRPGDKADITFVREGNTQTVTVTFKAAASANGEVDIDGSVVFYGARLKAAPAETLSAIGAKSGVEVVTIGEGKLSEQGVKAGSVILYVNNTAVSKPEEVVALAKKSARAVYIEGVDPDGKPFYVAFGK